MADSATLAATSTTTDEERIGLENGADVAYLVAEDPQRGQPEPSDRVTLLLTGSDVEDLPLHVRLWMTIGAITETVAEFDVVVGRGEQRLREIDVSHLGSWHQVQTEFTTRLAGEVLVTDDRSQGEFQKLESIYLVNPLPSGGFEFVLGDADFHRLFPTGFTTDGAEHRARETAALHGEEGSGAINFGSGVYKFRPHK